MLRTLALCVLLSLSTSLAFADGLGAAEANIRESLKKLKTQTKKSTKRDKAAGASASSGTR